MKIITALFVCILVIYAALWLLGGGLGRAFSSAQGINNPIASLFGGDTNSGSDFRLPWQPDFAMPDLSMTDSTGITDTNGMEETLPSAEESGTSLGNDVRTFGYPSPYAGKAYLSEDGTGSYFTIQADTSNDTSLALAGWSLQSAFNGARFVIPQAADTFVSGSINTILPVSLAPGETAHLSPRVSPVGVSFRENACIGYLGEHQEFVPELPVDCPPSANTPLECAGYVSSIPACHFPGRDSAPGVSGACRAYAATALSYTGCVREHRHDPDFKRSTWRLYYGLAQKVWRPHDVVRLLDSEGRVVDVLTY